MGKPAQFNDLAARLQPLAATLPTQNVAPPRPVAVVEAAAPPAKAAPAAAAVGEARVQVVFDLRAPQRKQLERLARDADMTTRAFILSALAAKGLEVQESDLLDRRKRRA